jgi:hypothetical protein
VRLAKVFVVKFNPTIELDDATGAVYVMTIVPLRPASVTVTVVEPTPTGDTPAVPKNAPEIVPTAVFEDDQTALALTGCEGAFE